MLKHHEDSIKKLVDLFKARDGVVSIILGGSVAKGIERPDSDIDAMIVLDDTTYERYSETEKTVEIITNEGIYEGGYFDVKYLNKHFLETATKQASEPTRNSFVKARVLYSKDSDIERLVSSIGRYPTEEKQDKIIAFLGYMGIDAFYFWGEAERTNDLFMKVKCAGNIVHFGLRLILAHNEQLFPCSRRLVETVERVERKPEGIISLANDFLANLDVASKDAFVNCVLSFTDWGVSFENDFSLIQSRYTDNNEQWWLKPCPLVAEW